LDWLVDDVVAVAYIHDDDLMLWNVFENFESSIAEELIPPFPALDMISNHVLIMHYHLMRSVRRITEQSQSISFEQFYAIDKNIIVGMNVLCRQRKVNQIFNYEKE
jgi:hypothetical protein